MVRRRRVSPLLTLGVGCLTTALGCGGRAHDSAHHSSGGQDTISSGGVLASGGQATMGGLTNAQGGGGRAESGGAAVGGEHNQGGDTSSAATGGAPFAGAPWRDSQQPFCSGVSDASFGWYNLWSDRRGVYLVAPGPAGGSSLWSNLGSGWSERSLGPRSNNSFGVSGFEGGDLVLYPGLNCGITFLRADGDSCSAAVSASRVFVVGDKLAYAISRDRVLKYAGEYWQQVGEPVKVTSGEQLAGLWANADTVFVTATDGRAFLYDGDQTTPRELIGASQTPSWAAWGSSADDLWLGNDGGELRHYDGKQWSTIWSSQTRCPGIRQIWGIDGVLYFTSGATLARYRAGNVEMILEAPCSERDSFTIGRFEEVRVSGLWGTSESEVFIAREESWATVFDSGEAIETRVEPKSGCGTLQLYWFDGSAVGRL